MITCFPFVGVQKQPPQDMPLLHGDCFDLKAMETLWVQEKMSPSQIPGRIKIGNCSQKKVIIGGKFYLTGPDTGKLY